MQCRPGCGACCIAASINSPMPGAPNGKPAGQRCLHLTADYLCALYGQSGRPAVCNNLRAEPEMCGDSREHALAFLADLEEKTRP